MKTYHADPTRRVSIIADLTSRTPAWRQAAERVGWLGQVHVLCIDMPVELMHFPFAMKDFVEHLMEKFWVLEMGRRRVRIVVEGCGDEEGTEWFRGVVEGVGFECVLGYGVGIGLWGLGCKLVWSEILVEFSNVGR